jgi:hypothetical protein
LVQGTAKTRVNSQTWSAFSRRSGGQGVLHQKISGYWHNHTTLAAFCRVRTTAQVPFGQAGAVVYGQNVNAAAILLASAGNVQVERTTMLMQALLASPVSTGFVARAHERFSDSTHDGDDINKWLEKHPRVTFHYTPSPEYSW